MKLENLQRLADHYGVSLIAVLMAPEETPKAADIRHAATLAERMDEKALAAWLATGELMAGKSKPE